MASRLSKTRGARNDEIVVISSDDDEGVGPKRKTKFQIPKQSIQKNGVTKKPRVQCDLGAPNASSMQQKTDAQLLTTMRTQNIRCKYCGWTSEVPLGGKVFKCNSCGFEPSPVKKDVIVNTDISARKSQVLNVEPVVISSDEDETDLRTKKKNVNISTNRYTQNFNELLKIKNSQIDNQQVGQKKQTWRYLPPGLPGITNKTSDNSPAGLLASLYPRVGSITTPGYTLSNANNVLQSENLPRHILQSENEAEVDNQQVDEAEPEKEEGEKTAPKDWDCALCVGFPAGWQWKKTNAWSRRVKFRSPEGIVFQARKGAVIHMEETKSYTKEQIDEARNADEQT